MKISSVLTPRQEVLEGNFQGALQAHQVHSDTNRLESNPASLFESTWPSNGIRNVIDRVRMKLSGKDHQGGFLLAGPYGAGKTHALVVLYHLFNDPQEGTNWLEKWHVDLDIPESSRSVILSTSEVDADHLWVPLFQRLGRADILDDVKRYPTIPQIEELAGDGPLAVFFDELETWYGSLSRDEPELIEQNEMFMQNLLEVAADQDQRVFVFITLLNKSDELKKILLRTNPIHEDLSTSGDRERLILHRLIATPREEFDNQAIEGIARLYVEAYEHPIEIEEPAKYRQRLEETYPFHPQLLGLIQRIYESAAARQNVRGAMNVLAEVLEDQYRETDLILTSQLDEAAFRGINMELVNRFEYDAEQNEETRDSPFAKEMLRTILLFTLDDKSRAATESDVVLGVFNPSRDSLNDVVMALTRLFGRAHYLHREDGHFMIKEGLNLIAMVDRESRAVEAKHEAKQEVFRVVRRGVFSGDVQILEEMDEVPDSPAILFLVMVAASESTEILGESLEDFFRGRKYQNSLVIVAQEGPSLLDDRELIQKANRIAAALRLRSRVEDPNQELPALVKDEREELARSLQDRFGRLVRWVETDDSGELRTRLIPVRPSIADIRERIGVDRSYIADHIEDEVRSAQSGRRVESLLSDFKRFRRLPVLLDDEAFYGAVRVLYQDARIVLEGDKAKMYVPGMDPAPQRISDELTIHHPSHVPQEILSPPEPAHEPGEDKDTWPDDGEPKIEKSYTLEHIPIEGNSPRAIVSMAEARINQASDQVRSLRINFSFEQPLAKEKLLDFLESLPTADKLVVNLEVERDRAED